MAGMGGLPASASFIFHRGRCGKLCNPGTCQCASVRQTAEEVGIVGKIAQRGLGKRGAFGDFPEFQMLQDFLDDGWIVDQADDAHEVVASRADGWVHFVDLSNQPGPIAPALLAELVVLLG